MRWFRSVRRVTGKFFGLRWPERVAVVRATFLLVLARASLSILPFSTVLRFADRVPASATRSSQSQPDLPTMVWAVTAVGNRLFPTTPCLTQAVVIHRLLRQGGKPTELRIGVRKDRKGKFGAHAWVESEGEIVIGAEGLSEGFVPLPPVRRDVTEA